MARYYFPIDDGRFTLDIEGTEIEGLAKAKCRAVMAGTIICNSAAEFWDRSEWNMTVADGDGLTIFTSRFLGTEAPAAQIPVSLRPQA